MARKTRRKARFVSQGSGYSTHGIGVPDVVSMTVAITDPGPDYGREVVVSFTPAELRKRLGDLTRLADHIEERQEAARKRAEERAGE